MTHQQTWLEIAEAFATESDDRTDRQRSLSAAGLCWAFSHFKPKDDTVWDKFRDFWDGVTDYGSYKNLWLPRLGNADHHRKHDLLRSTFACFIAAMTEEDFNLIIGV